MPRSFVTEYFDNKPLAELKRAVTPNWSEENLRHHLALLNAPPGAKRILEIGCGLGRLLIPLYDVGAEHCVGFDASRSMVKAGQRCVKSRNIQLLLCDGRGAVNYPVEGYFDFAFAFTVFQHIPDIDTVKEYLGEMHRLLAPGGIARFQVLGSDIKPGRELWTYHNIQDLTGHLEALGFGDIGIEWGGAWAIISARK